MPYRTGDIPLIHDGEEVDEGDESLSLLGSALTPEEFEPLIAEGRLRLSLPASAHDTDHQERSTASMGEGDKASLEQWRDGMGAIHLNGTSIVELIDQSGSKPVYVDKISFNGPVTLPDEAFAHYDVE